MTKKSEPKSTAKSSAKKNVAESSSENRSIESNSIEQLSKAVINIQKQLNIQQEDMTANNSRGYENPVHKECCCFEIILFRARVLKDQGGLGSTEPGDGGLLSKNMELIFGATADGFSGVYPTISSHVSMSENSGWHIFNQKIALVSGGQAIPVSTSAREVETTAVGGRPEYGNSETAYLNLECECPVIPLQFSVKLSAGGITKRGEVLIEITAKKVCCPC